MASTSADYFDEKYYRKWYGHAHSRAFTSADKKVRAAFVLSYLRYLRVPVRSVCDVGCGLGHWREALQAVDGRIKYTGVEISPVLSQRMGWIQASAASYAPKRKFDLVICQAVLQHLDDRDCAQALDNICAYTRGALYLEVLTKADWAAGCVDKRHTERHPYLRTGAWYRKRLEKAFTPLGGGLFLAKTTNAPMFELEQLSR